MVKISQKAKAMHLPSHGASSALDDGVSLENPTKKIPRPDISVSQIVLLILSQVGRATFQEIHTHPYVRLLGSQRSENSFYTALARLKRRRAIARSTDHVYELTALGEYAALKAYVRKEHTMSEREQREVHEKKSKPHAWDGKWRIVLFDVPESKRPLRDYLRRVLQRQGFVEFQRSMWVWPYRVPSFITKLLSDPHMRSYTRAITTYDIDYDEDLRKKFKLG